MRRFTRLTSAFSKKLQNLKGHVALHFAFYNFVRIHQTLRVTPAMAVGITPGGDRPVLKPSCGDYGGPTRKAEKNGETPQGRGFKAFYLDSGGFRVIITI